MKNRMIKGSGEDIDLARIWARLKPSTGLDDNMLGKLHLTSVSDQMIRKVDDDEGVSRARPSQCLLRGESSVF